MFRPKGKSLTIDDLKKIPLKAPPAYGTKLGGYWKGIPHAEFAEAVKRHLSVHQERYAVSKDKYDLAAGYSAAPEEVKSPKGMRFALGFLTSNARRFGVKAFYGVDCVGTGRGLVLGRVGEERKHTKDFDLDAEVEETVRLFRRTHRHALEQLKALAADKVTDAEADSLIMEAGRKGLIPWSRVGQVSKHWRNPTHDETEPRTALALYHCFSLAIAKNPPLDQMPQLEGFYRLLAARAETASTRPAAARKPAGGKKPLPARKPA